MELAEAVRHGPVHGGSAGSGPGGQQFLLTGRCQCRLSAPDEVVQTVRVVYR